MSQCPQIVMLHHMYSSYLMSHYHYHYCPLYVYFAVAFIVIVVVLRRGCCFLGGSSLGLMRASDYHPLPCFHCRFHQVTGLLVILEYMSYYHDAYLILRVAEHRDWLVSWEQCLVCCLLGNDCHLIWILRSLHLRPYCCHAYQNCY